MANTFSQETVADLGGRGYISNARIGGGSVLDILQFPLDIGVNSNTGEPQQPHYMVIYINEIKAGAYNSSNDNTFSHSTDVPVFLESGSSHTNKLLSSGINGKDGESAPPVPKTVSTSTLPSPSATEKAAYDAAVKELASGDFSKQGNFARDKQIISNYKEKYPDTVTGNRDIQKQSGPFGSAYGSANKYANEQHANLVSSVNDGIQEAKRLDNKYKFAPEIKRTVITVVLPMPDQVQTSYDPQWSEDTSEIVGNIIGAADEIRNSPFNGKSDSMMKWFKNAGIAFTGNSLQNITQKVTNPRSQMLFQNMSFRDFSWTWTLYPKNAKEAKALWDIIEFMKYHILPEYDTENSGGVFLIQPSLFDIEFHSHGQRNDWLPKTLTCFCKNISVDYAPAGTVAFFEPYRDPITNRDVSAPIGVRLSMSFMENEILTKNRVRGDEGAGHPAAPKYGFNQGNKSTNGTF